MRKRKAAMSANERKKRYGDGTSYTDDKGKRRTRISKPGTKRGDAYCARSLGQVKEHGMTPKLKQRRKDWGCSGAKSKKG